MSRTARASAGDVCYHVLNRANGRQRVFHGDDDYAAFLDLLAAACARQPLRVLGLCLLPNHFRLLLWPHEDGDLSRWMQWLLTSHVRRYHGRRGTSGHVWQGRFKAFPIAQDEHFLTVLRYVERNPRRAGLVQRAEDWPWSSLALRARRSTLLAALPVPLPRNWTARVNRAETEAELAAVRQSVVRGTPFGAPAWQVRTAAELGLESALRPRGRPRKTPEK
jgi:putative transposase